MVRKIDTDEFDRIFDEGKENIFQYADMSSARQPNREPRTVAVDMPQYVLAAVEREAARAGVPVAELIESWIEEKLGPALPRRTRG